MITILEEPTPERSLIWRPGIDMRLGDCMDLMRAAPDKHWDLAIVDPPYFERGGDPEYYKGRTAISKAKPITETWDIPGEKYFDELFRVSRAQIIWGCNYYERFIPFPGRIIWDKCNDNSPFSQAEIAAYSSGIKVSMFRFLWNGMLQQNMGDQKEERFHPTQKPVALYKWLLTRYAKPGWKILDTHGGSGSHCIAAHDLGFDLTWIEKDTDYYATALKRYKDHASQLHLIEPATVVPMQADLL